MNMVGKIRDKNETMDMDQLFSSGYIIELETGKYLSGYNKKSIRSSPLERAIRFRSKQQAAECISQHLCYVGLEAWICEILWVLLSYKYELEGLAEYWTGTVFSDQFQSAVTFTTYPSGFMGNWSMWKICHGTAQSGFLKCGKSWKDLFLEPSQSSIFCFCLRTGKD